MASPSNPLAVATTQNIGNLITSLQIKTANVRIHDGATCMMKNLYDCDTVKPL